MRRLAEEAFCVEYIRRIRRKDRGIGGGKLWKMYHREFGAEHSVGYNRFYDIIEKYGLKVDLDAKVEDIYHGNPVTLTFSHLLSGTLLGFKTAYIFEAISTLRFIYCAICSTASEILSPI